MKAKTEEAATELTEHEEDTFIGSLIQRYGGWTKKIVGSLLDQGLFAGANFVINILLANWMPKAEYGAFSVAYAWFLLLENFYEAILTEPMAIFGSGKYALKFRHYLGRLYFGHIGVGLFSLLILGSSAILAHFFDSDIIAVALAGAAFSAPVMLVRWLVKTPFYVLSTPHWSALGGIFYFIFSMVGLFVLKQIGGISSFTVLIVMGLAGLMAGILLTIFLLHPIWDFKNDGIQGKEVLSDHWQYGKWATPSRFLVWIPANVYTIALPLFYGLAATAALRALTNLVMPMLMATSAITGILLPSFVRTFQRSGKADLDRRVDFVMRALVVVTGIYFVVTVVFGRQIMHLIYGGRFDESVTLPLLVITGLMPMGAVLNTVIDTALRAVGGIKQSFMAKILPTILTLTVGMVLVSTLSVTGANLGVFITSLSTYYFVRFYYLRQKSVPTGVQEDNTLSGEMPDQVEVAAPPPGVSGDII